MYQPLRCSLALLPGDDIAAVVDIFTLQNSLINNFSRYEG